MAREFDGAHIDGSGLGTLTVEELADPSAFAAWVDAVRAGERGEGLAPGHVPATLWWLADRDEIVGTIQLRHSLNDYLQREGGHIGYAVRPSARRRGHAGAGLELVLDECVRRGIDPVLLTCDDDNVGSSRTIEAHGGVLEDVVAGLRRYWVTLRDR